MPTKKEQAVDITEAIDALEAIVRWFDEQDRVDVAEGLVKVKEGAALVRDLKARLKDVENEFTELKRELESDDAA